MILQLKAVTPSAPTRQVWPLLTWDGKQVATIAVVCCGILGAWQPPSAGGYVRGGFQLALLRLFACIIHKNTSSDLLSLLVQPQC